jgi:hypothetical protein
MDGDKKIGDLGSEISLLQHGFADESVAGLYYTCQPAFAKQCLIIATRHYVVEQSFGMDSRVTRHPRPSQSY